MKKTLRNILLAGALASVVTAPIKSQATVLEYITTSISADNVDQDPNRAGVQIRYDWTVKNKAGQDGVNDSVWEYAIQANLQERGMYGFTNNKSPWSSSADSLDNSYLWLANLTDSTAITPGVTKTFSAFIDQDLIIGNEQVASYGLSNNGQTNSFDVTVPIPEPMSAALLALGAGALLATRRIRENAKRR